MRGKSRGDKRPVVLYTSPLLRHPPRSGPQLRVENTLKALSRIADVHLFSRVMPEAMGETSALRFYQGLCRTVRQAPFTQDSKSPFHNAARHIAQGLGLFEDRPIGRESARDYRALLRMAESIRADVIWLGYGNLSYPLLRFIKDHSQFPVVLDTDSVWSRYVLRGIPFAASEEERGRLRQEGEAKAEEERWGTALADITVAVSEVDAEYYRQLAHDSAQVCVVSNGIDLDAYTPAPEPPPGMKHPCVYLAGTFWPGSPMEHAAHWLVEVVLPLVRRTRPGLHVYILGNGSRETLSELPRDGVDILGEVECVLPWLCHADAVAVPLHFESGTRFKILEAGACRKAVVSTTLGAEGLNAIHGTDIVIADSAETFAQGILSVLDNPDTSRVLGDRLRVKVESEFGIDTIARQAGSVLDCLL
ncbi:MAG: glycosyltransferase [Candidatus Hydrogenedentes bacterium]|nr:glycosyltransferase [Candidatus Hydrogenedentota bacterium]